MTNLVKTKITDRADVAVLDVSGIRRDRGAKLDAGLRMSSAAVEE